MYQFCFIHIFPYNYDYLYFSYSFFVSVLNCLAFFFLFFQGFLYSSPDSSADWFGGRLTRECFYSSSQSYDESDLDLNHSLRLHALIENIVNFISGDVGNAPAFKEPEESVSTSPQAIITAMEQQQSRAEVCGFNLFYYTI